MIQIVSASVGGADFRKRAALAQLVEHWLCNPKVPGSNPGGGSTIKTPICQISVFLYSEIFHKVFNFFLTTVCILVVMSEHDKEIIRLYSLERLSVMQIAGIKDISWRQIEKILTSNEVQKRSISEAITSHHITKFGLKEFSLKEDLTIKDQQLKIAGIMLYAGEGSKTGNVVALSNSNPKIIKLFLYFLRNVCGIAENRLRVTIHYYDDLNPDELITFWSTQTSVPKSQFHKPFLHITTKGTYRSKSHYGTVTVQYSDKKLLKIILNWIEDYYIQTNCS